MDQAGASGGQPGATGSQAGATGTQAGSNGSPAGGAGAQAGTAGVEPGAAGGGIDYGSGDDPFADLARGREGTMTAAERRAVLDERLNEGYAVFDGMILTERERVQAQAQEQGRSGRGGVMASGQGGGDDAYGAPEGAIVVASAPNNSSGGGFLPGGAPARQGDFSHEGAPTYPIPEDIPSGNDDDVVARQLREAAMREPDPELREKLWDEYRQYTGLAR